MTDEKHILEAAVRREPLDPLEVLVPEPSAGDQGSEYPDGQRPQGSFEIAWRLAH